MPGGAVHRRERLAGVETALELAHHVLVLLVRYAAEALVLDLLPPIEALLQGVDAQLDLGARSPGESLRAHLRVAAALAGDLIAVVVHPLLEPVEDLVG